MNGKTTSLQNINDVIDIILNGTPKEKEKYINHYFKVADTGKLLKKNGFIGDYISVRYGVITHHKSKDTEHNLSADDWHQISRKINTPLAIADHNGAGRLFLDIERNGKYVIIGIDIKNTSQNTYINAITTTFYKDRLNDKILYVDKKITAEQQALLGRPNSPSYLAASGLK